MDKEIKKYLKKLGDELKYGRTYLYARDQTGKAPYRFSFSHHQKKGLKTIRNFLRYKGLSVKTWRPTNAK